MNIEEIDEQIQEHWVTINELKKLRNKAELEGYNYEGKFIYMPDYGYMYVTWQCIDNSTFTDTRMFFQGFSFDFEDSDFRDHFWLSTNAMENWWIPIEMFKDFVREDRIKEISKEEFIRFYKEGLDSISENYTKMLDWVIECDVKTIN